MNTRESRKNTGVKGRRKFLKGLAGAGGAAAVAIATPTVATAADAGPEDAPKPVDSGYHVTKHIEDYYETARA
jgi:hypothetical protein